MTAENKPNCSFLAAGVMSGTSLDGMDMALCRFNRSNTKWSFSIISAATVAYSDYWRDKLSHLDILSDEGLKTLDKEYGKLLGNEVKQFLHSSGHSPQFIASHGHTVYHRPEIQETLQIGNGKVIANITQLKVINDFRSADVTMGGQGAPLVPIGDLHLFPEFENCLNIGGICNISRKSKNHIEAFDVCVANIAFNFFARKRGIPYDDCGNLGRSGRVCDQLLIDLNEMDYFSQSPPKSLDASFFQDRMLPLILKYELTVEDTLCTLYHHLAGQVLKVVGSKKEILLTGGGAHNDFLVECMEGADLIPVIPSDIIIDFKEALIFAFMGVLFELSESNILSSVTGAPKDHIGGVVHMPEIL